MDENTEMTPMANLVLHVMYEFQHLAGSKGMSVARMQEHIHEVLAEFGDIPSAIKGIRERCGLS